MNKEIKKKWIEALRSGDYDQGKGALYAVTDEGAKYCCLGVLQEVAYGEDHWVETALDTLASNGSTWCLSPKDIESHGLVDENHTWHIIHLMDMNDSKGSSFGEIADWIEDHL